MKRRPEVKLCCTYPGRSLSVVLILQRNQLHSADNMAVPEGETAGLAERMTSMLKDEYDLLQLFPLSEAY